MQSSSLILLAVFAFVTLSVVGLFLLIANWDDRRLRGKRLREVRGFVERRPQEIPTTDGGSVFRDELVRGSPILRFLRAALPAGLSDIEARLEQAGMDTSPRRFAQMWVALIIFGGLLGLATTAGAAGFFLGAILGAIAPSFVIQIKKRRRDKSFEAQFPEALRLLATSLKAGHALPISIRMMGEELPPPVSVEFQKAAEENRLGVRMEDALKNMTFRIDSQDLRFFVTSVMIQRETGGNLADVLEKLDELIRERFKLRRHIKAITAPGRMAGYLLAVLPLGVGLLFTLINPDYMAPLWETPVGRFIAVAAFMLQGAGYIVIRRIVNVRI